MRYFLRLILIPALAALVTYFCITIVLRLDLPRTEYYFSLTIICGVPAIVAFFSELHRIDVLDRIDRLEKQLEKLQHLPASSDEPR